MKLKTTYLIPKGLGPTSNMIESTDGIVSPVGYVTLNVSWYPEPSWLRVRAEKLANPPTTGTVIVPVTVAF